MKTVCWYLHTFQLLYFSRITVVTSDRQEHHLSYGRALREYGFDLVYDVNMTADSLTMFLA